jgi:uncharacterized RDD family membrane protein YckC
MQTIRVETTQNVAIDYPLASVGDRLIAHVIDLGILAIYLTGAIALMMHLDIQSIWIVLCSLGIPFLFYTLAFEIMMNGQTPGKSIMKVKVIRLDGTPATIGDYLLRWLFRIVDFYIASGAVAMIVISAGGKGQRLGDIVAGTCAIKLTRPREVSSNDLFIIPDETYTPVFAEVINLSTRDIELVQKALEVNKNYGNNKPAALLSHKIQSVLGIESDMPPVKFLYTVVRDFNHYTSQPA